MRKLIVTLLVATVALAGSPVDAVNKTGKNIAIQGYDPVAYFTQGAPVTGSPQFAQQWMGATWLFQRPRQGSVYGESGEVRAPIWRLLRVRGEPRPYSQHRSGTLDGRRTASSL